MKSPTQPGSIQQTTQNQQRFLPRIAKAIRGTPEVTVHHGYDGDQIIAEYDGAGTLLRKFCIRAGDR